MKFSNITIEEIKNEHRILAGNDTIRIEIPVKRKSNLLLPDSTGSEIIWAEFKTMSVENYWFIEKLSKNNNEYNYEEIKKLIIKFQLKKWNISLDLKFENEMLTDECWKKILKLQAPIIDALVTEYQQSYIINDEEEEQIDRQSAILFAPHGRGVDNACEAITLFCVLGNFWEKFGINRFDLKKLSYKEYIMLRMILGKEIDRTKAMQNKGKKKNAAMIAGPGGRTRPSRGITIENPD